jgi:hypothetical protein
MGPLLDRDAVPEPLMLILLPGLERKPMIEEHPGQHQ